MSRFRKLTALGFALVAITLIFMLFSSQPDPSPYSGMSYYSIFEGLEDEEEEEKKIEGIGRDMEKQQKDGLYHDMEKQQQQQKKAAAAEEDKVKEKEKEKKDGVESFFADSSIYKSVSSLFEGNSSTKSEGFEPIIAISKTLNPGTLRDTDIIDKFSKITANGIEGKDGCISSGLTNSGGSICLTPELIQLLKTRGGNATGGECHVGQPSSK